MQSLVSVASRFLLGHTQVDALPPYCNLEALVRAGGGFWEMRAVGSWVMRIVDYEKKRVVGREEIRIVGHGEEI